MQVNPARLQAITHRTGHIGGQVITHVQNLPWSHAQRLRCPMVHITKGFGATVRPRLQQQLRYRPPTSLRDIIVYLWLLLTQRFANTL